jgi:6-phosphogluconolactonase
MESNEDGRQAPAANDLFVLVACPGSGSIVTFAVDPSVGTLRRTATQPGIGAVRTIAVDPERLRLHTITNTNPAVLNTWTMDTATGTLQPLAAVSLPATAAYACTDGSGNFLLYSSYADSVIVSREVPGEGLRDAVRQSVHGPVPQAHCILPSPDNRFIYYTSLVDDLVWRCTLDPGTGELLHHEAVHVVAGTGPRHLRFSPQGNHLYALGELTGTVTVFDRAEDTGLLTSKQEIASVPADLGMTPGWARLAGTPDPPPSAVWCAELRLTPDGSFLFTSERASSTVSVFRRHPDTGLLTYLYTVPTAQQPRGMNVDPSGRFLLVCGELSDTIFVHEIDPATGSLRHTNTYSCDSGPMWLEFVQSAAGGSG